MKPSIASLINALILILLGLWGYFGSGSPSLTALIPAVVGLVMLLLNGALRRENRIVAHVVVVLTFLILIALVKPLAGAISRSDIAAVIRVGFMLASTLLALIFFVKSFLDARKKKDEL